LLCNSKFYSATKAGILERMQKSAFFNVLDEFLQKRKLSDVRDINFMVLKRALQRYELFVAKNELVKMLE
jgi:hypothetical protein